MCACVAQKNDKANEANENKNSAHRMPPGAMTRLVERDQLAG
ncbi:MAG: hypothetical protein RL020_48 [Pseudomonadota bacterium]|jgi:hypothetical protein